MRKKLIIIPLLCLFATSVFAQQKVTVRMEQQLLTDLFEVIEQQTNYRIYSLPANTDSVRVSINAIEEEALIVLQLALEKTSLKASHYANRIFITDDDLITSLPEGYFQRDRAIGTEEFDISGLSLSQRTQRASSENKVYEIGDPAVNPTGRVSLSGTLIDFKTGEPVIGAALFIEEPMIGVTSDAYGYYTIQLPVGRHDLRIRGVGVKDTHRQIMVHSEGKMDIELEEEVYALREVVISGERVQNVRRTTMGVERLQIRDIKNIPTAFGEVDVIKAVLLLPGVKSAGEASSGFNVRGGSTDQNLILFNDGTIYNPTHLFGFFSAFNPDLIRDMELFKSSIPAKYGGRISSVLDLSTREGNKKEFGGSASIGLLTSSLTLEGPLFNDKTSYIIGGRTTYSDWILKQLPDDSGYQDGKAGFYDLNASVNHKFSDYDNLSIHGYFSNDRFQFTDEERYSYQNANASIKWRHLFNPKLTSIITAGYDHYDYDTKNTENPANAFSLSFDINQYFGKADFTWYANDQHTLDFGVNGLLYDLNPGTYLPEGEESLVVKDRLQKEKAIESGIYVEDRWDILPGLSVNAGIRYSMFNVLGPRDYYTYQDEYIPSTSTIVDTVSVDGKAFKTYHGPEFRLSARYEFDNNFSIKAGFNTMRQNIHKISNTTVMSPTDTWKLSDANIKPQTGSQLALGLYKNFANNTIETSIETYYKKMNDYLDYRNGAELLMNHHLETDVLNTEGRAYGVELMIKKTQGKLNGWISYTYSRTELRQNDPKVIDPVNGGNWYPADYDKPHDFKFVGNYKFTHRFSFSMNLDYSTGRPITLPVSKYNYAGGEYVYFSDRNKYRIPDFFRIDASINIEPSHNLTLLTHSTISLGVYNLTGRKNAYSVYYVAEEGRLKGYKLAIFGSPIPYISYNIKF